MKVGLRRSSTFLFLFFCWYIVRDAYFLLSHLSYILGVFLMAGTFKIVPLTKNDKKAVNLWPFKVQTPSGFERSLTGLESAFASAGLSKGGSEVTTLYTAWEKALSRYRANEDRITKLVLGGFGVVVDIDGVGPSVSAFPASPDTPGVPGNPMLPVVDRFIYGALSQSDLFRKAILSIRPYDMTSSTHDVIPVEEFRLRKMVEALIYGRTEGFCHSKSHTAARLFDSKLHPDVVYISDSLCDEGFVLTKRITETVNAYGVPGLVNEILSSVLPRFHVESLMGDVSCCNTSYLLKGEEILSFLNKPDQAFAVNPDRYVKLGESSKPRFKSVKSDESGDSGITEDTLCEFLAGLRSVLARFEDWGGMVRMFEAYTASLEGAPQWFTGVALGESVDVLYQYWLTMSDSKLWKMDAPAVVAHCLDVAGCHSLLSEQDLKTGYSVLDTGRVVLPGVYGGRTKPVWSVEITRLLDWTKKDPVSYTDKDLSSLTYTLKQVARQLDTVYTAVHSVLLALSARCLMIADPDLMYTNLALAQQRISGVVSGQIIVTRSSVRNAQVLLSYWAGGDRSEIAKAVWSSAKLKDSLKDFSDWSRVVWTTMVNIGVAVESDSPNSFENIRLRCSSALNCIYFLDCYSMSTLIRSGCRGSLGSNMSAASSLVFKDNPLDDIGLSASQFSMLTDGFFRFRELMFLAYVTACGMSAYSLSPAELQKRFASWLPSCVDGSSIVQNTFVFPRYDIPHGVLADGSSAVDVNEALIRRTFRE